MAILALTLNANVIHYHYHYENQGQKEGGRQLKMNHHDYEYDCLKKCNNSNYISDSGKR